MMIIKSKVWTWVAILIICQSPLVPSLAQTADYAVVPLPQKIEMQKGESFMPWYDQLRIFASEELTNEAMLLWA